MTGPMLFGSLMAYANMLIIAWLFLPIELALICRHM